MADTPALGDNPTDEQLRDALATIRAGGSLRVGDDFTMYGPHWPLAVVRYVNELGPTPDDPFGAQAYDRVKLADQSAA